LLGNESTQKERFSKVMHVANEIAIQNPDALKDFIRLLGRKLQSDYMCRAIFAVNERKIPDLEPKQVWFDEFMPITLAGKSLHDLKIKSSSSHDVNLASDIVLPWPWNLDRVASCISHIGTGKSAGTWKQDSMNHKIEYWLPFGISWVHRGNHSIMSGIIQGQGVIETDSVYDLSSLFEHVKCDGANFYRIHDNQVIQSVVELEFAAIFEVGKLMNKHGING